MIGFTPQATNSDCLPDEVYMYLYFHVTNPALALILLKNLGEALSLLLTV